MKKLRNWVIGGCLAKTDDVFTKAKITLLYNFVLFFFINSFLFCGNVLANHYYYHGGILLFGIIMQIPVVIAFRKYRNYELAAKIFILNQVIVGIVSYIIQQASMDYVGEFFIIEIILVTFFTLGKRYGFIITGIWFLQLIQCMANYLSGGKFVLVHVPKDQILPPSPVAVLVPFFLCIYIIYQFVRTRAIAEASIQSQKEVLEVKNREITDSITYAKRIQQAKLPDIKAMKLSLPESFVLFRPKDIVSGDFYYFNKTAQYIFIAAADCTGHGVPGAFMSIIGSEKLHDAVSQSSDPAKILNLLNIGIKTTLRQSEHADSTRDGMDIALCVLDVDSGTLIYSGANRPFWLARNGSKEVEEIKATKKAIGGFTEDTQVFDKCELKLEKGDVFYLFTDGYVDMFGGDKGKKLTTKRFRQILSEIQYKNMMEQEKHLEDFADNWQKGGEQIDDILVIGVKL